MDSIEASFAASSSSSSASAASPPLGPLPFGLDVVLHYINDYNFMWLIIWLSAMLLLTGVVTSATEAFRNAAKRSRLMRKRKIATKKLQGALAPFATSNSKTPWIAAVFAAIKHTNAFRMFIWEQWPVHIKAPAKKSASWHFSHADAEEALRDGYGCFALKPNENEKPFCGYKLLQVQHNTELLSIDRCFKDVQATVSVTSAGVRSKAAAVLCCAAQAAFEMPVNSNMYASPPRQDVAVPAHSDAEDNIILQCVGRKTWRLYEPKPPFTHPLTMKGMQLGKSVDAGGSETKVQRGIMSSKPVLEVTLAPGDMLYVPRGFVHATSTVDDDSPSIHLTLSLLSDTGQFTYTGALKHVVLASSKKRHGQARMVALKVVEPGNAVDRYSRADHTVRRALPMGFAFTSIEKIATTLHSHCKRAAKYATDNPIYAKELKGISREDCEDTARVMDSARADVCARLAELYGSARKHPGCANPNGVQSILNHHMNRVFVSLMQ